MGFSLPYKFKGTLVTITQDPRHDQICGMNGISTDSRYSTTIDIPLMKYILYRYIYCNGITIPIGISIPIPLMEYNYL